MSALEAIDITKTYHEAGRAYDVLKGVNLCIQKGEVVALEGRSGSGKTTLLSILGCIMQPTDGRIVIDGRDVIVKTAVMVRRLSLGFVFQNCNLIPALRARQTVSYVLRLKGWAAKSAMGEAERLLELIFSVVKSKGWQLRGRWRAILPSSWPMNPRPTLTPKPPGKF